jgi:hypothetical protein
MRSLAFALLLSLALGALAAPPAVRRFDSEEKASVQCPLDTIVWFNPHTHLWYMKRSKHYANDGYGGFACLGEVRKAGYKQGKG